MATIHNDYAHEKQLDEEKREDEKPTFIENAHNSPTDTSLDLTKERTLEEIDIHNRSALKGDDSDGKVTFGIRGALAAIFLAGLYTGKRTLSLSLLSICISNVCLGSQVILYFTGGSLSFIAEDLKITQGSAWLPTANILAIAATCPFAGYLQDLFGKRYIALFGSACICIGIILMATTHSFAQALAGMTIAGVGAAIGELTGLAG